MEKQNRRKRQARKKEELARIRLLVGKASIIIHLRINFEWKQVMML